jgi:hypothetical protein
VERLAQVYASVPLLFWVGASLLAYLLATNFGWLVRATAWEGTLPGRWVKEVARFLFYLGLPYVALGGWPQRPLQGLLSLGDLGLIIPSPADAALFTPSWSASRWLEAVGTGLGLGLLLLLILAVAWFQADRTGFRLGFPRRPWWALAVDAVYLQVHWAFYRAALASTLADLYAGLFVGLGLIYLEWALNPFWRRDWRVPGRAGGRWLRVALALGTALIYLLTRNLWVCLVVHWPLELFFWRLGRPRGAVAASLLNAR